MTGYATTEVGVRRAFLYSDGKMNPIKGDGNTSAGWAINAGGEVAGDASFDASGACAKDLGTLGGAESLAYALNDAGELVGVSDTAGGQRHALLYREGIMKGP